MTAPEPEEARPGFALAEFEDGFRHGYRGEPRAKGRSGTYRNAYERGREAAARDAA